MDSTQIALHELAESTAMRDGYDWSKISDQARRDYLALARTMQNRIDGITAYGPWREVAPS